MSAWQRPLALDVTSTLDKFEVFGHFAPYLASMVAAFERELITYPPLLACRHPDLLIPPHYLND
jgi:hypothetical protein